MRVMLGKAVKAGICFYALLTGVVVRAQQIDVYEEASASSFPLVGDCAATIVRDKADAEVVDVAVNLLATDIRRVTGRKPDVCDSLSKDGKPVVVVGTVGQSRFIDALVRSGKLDVSAIKGQWESYVITVLEQPVEGLGDVLVIAGSDRRGTAYGLFELSGSIGVSPWYWWADVPVAEKKQVHVSRKTIVQGPPSVKYRGIFINDEDWGLQPWAARQMDADIKDIGPNTYEKVFELLLRLKANFIWPAMHPCTQAFNIYEKNKVVADRYAIVMGASHCEPMLCNNVTEWDKKTMGDWNYETNPDGIYDYWESRLKENGRYENVYTVGMRGIHDSGVPGGGSREDKKNRLQRVISDQRKILSDYVNPDPALVPQIFCPYKEVLDIYKLGLNLPDDVTIVWPDDNHGYIRNLSTPVERKRSGGSGIYYHLSYWGAPQDYLWISSSSPAKIAYEMQKAYAYGAEQLWVFNVGDIKPCEMEMDFALQLAYDVNRWPAAKAMTFIDEWAARTFGESHAAEIGGIYREYYRLVQQARPEHMDQVNFSRKEQQQRLEAYADISKRAEAIYAGLDKADLDAFFELVLYPVRCADLMNRKWTYSNWGEGKKAVEAYGEIQELTQQYNNKIADGKWAGIMDSAPRRRPVFKKPSSDRISTAEPMVSLEPKDATCSGKMELSGGGILSGDSGIQKEDSDSRAEFRFKADHGGKADLYFLAQCADEEHDSWFVSFNGKKIVSNDHATGAEVRWFKIMDVELEKGRNELVVVQREPGAVLRQVVLMEPGCAPPEASNDPAYVFAAPDYAEIKNGAASKWEKISGLGIESGALAVMPYETEPLSERKLAQAPAVAYTFSSDASACSIESRFLPTHRINEGMQLRYAVQVDGGPVEVRDINVPSKSGTWADNVLRGYSFGRSEHELKQRKTHSVTIYLLDPGMVLSQVRVLE